MMTNIKDLVNDFETKLELISDVRLNKIKEELIKAGLNNEQVEFFAMLCDDLEHAGYNRGYKTALRNNNDKN